MPFGLDNDLWQSVLAGLARGSYNALLGAGASIGGRDGVGGSIPHAAALTADLVKEFDLPPTGGEPLSLSRAYAAAARQVDGDAGNVDDYLKNRFTGCTAPAWMAHFTRIRWSRIWTLNIDDTLDHAYVNAKRFRAQKLLSTQWDHPYFDSRSDDRATVVYLHGRARWLGDAQRPARLVFSLNQYLDAGGSQQTWHRVFGDLFREEPFLAVGASLTEEFDLAAILERGNASAELHGRPSLVVLKTVDPFRQDELRAAGLIPIEATAEQFFEAVARELPAVEEALPGPRRGSGRLAPQEMRFLSQFKPLQAERQEERDRRHDLYSGHEPTWQDIVRDRDAVFSIVQRLEDAVVKALSHETRHRVVCLYGPRFTGKTAVLYRTARRLIARGVDVYRFIGDEKMDLDAIQWWVERSGPTALVVDGLADFAPDLTDFLARVSVDENQVVVLGAERETRLRRLEANLPPDRLRASVDLRLTALGDADITALIGRLRDAGRLGRISQRKYGGQVTYFRNEHDRVLFSAMAGLEHGQGFSVRLRAQYNDLDDRALQTVYAAASLVHSVGYPTPIALFRAICGVTPRELVKAWRDNENFADLVVISGDKLQTRQRALASLVVEDVLQKDDRYRLSASIAAAISAYLSPQAIGQRTLHARIAAELMDEKILADWIGAGRVEEWYEEQAASYGWNARFWEQRALAASGRNLWDRAESYAEKAVDLHRDPFTLNTLGTVLLRKALAVTEPGSETRADYFRRATDELESSRRAGRDQYMHPYITFFDYTLRVAREEVDRPNGIVPQPAIRLWDEWLRRARTSAVFAHEDLRRQLEDYAESWLLLAAGSS